MERINSRRFYRAHMSTIKNIRDAALFVMAISGVVTFILFNALIAIGIMGLLNITGSPEDGGVVVFAFILIVSALMFLEGTVTYVSIWMLEAKWVY